MNNIRIALLITEYRRRHQISQTEFGKLLGVSAQAVSKWEREVCYPDVTILPDLAKILRIEINDLFEI